MATGNRDCEREMSCCGLRKYDEAIAYNRSSRWFHRSCENISHRDFGHLSKTDVSWFCKECVDEATDPLTCEVPVNTENPRKSVTAGSPKSDFEDTFKTLLVRFDKQESKFDELIGQLSLTKSELKSELSSFKRGIGEMISELVTTHRKFEEKPFQQKVTLLINSPWWHKLSSVEWGPFRSFLTIVI